MSLWKNKCGGEKNYSKHVKVYFKVVKEEKNGCCTIVMSQKAEEKKWWHMKWKKKIGRKGKLVKRKKNSKAKNVNMVKKVVA